MNIKKKKTICALLFVILVLQITAVNVTASIYMDFSKNKKQMEDSVIDVEDTFISETIRGQQQNMLSSLKQSWVKYLDANNDSDLLIEDNEGYPIYTDIDNDEQLGFNSKTMYKDQIENEYLYNIHDKETNKILISKSKPQWNSKKITEMLDILVSPVKKFGNNGGMIVYDSSSGEIFLDTTPAQRIAAGEKASIFNDHLNSTNKNKYGTNVIANKYLKIKKDSNTISNIIYPFNESTIMGEDSSNFSKFPLGSFNRQFVEMSIMPYETIGFDGQPMQLTILSIVDEQDISSVYKNISLKTKDIMIGNKQLYEKVSMMLIFSLIGTMIIMLIALYVLKYKFNNDEKH